jgi:thiol-disulfide isomerase/thioredoxin
MKKIIPFIFLITSLLQAQYTIKGTMSPTIESEWIILYKIEGTQQNYVQHSKIEVDTITLQENKKKKATFQFILPEDTPIGSYRVVYGLEEPGFVDFFYNKENIHFDFDPKSPNQSINFSISRENRLYQKYITLISKEQRKLDAIQNTTIQNPSLNLQSAYKKALTRLKNIQKECLKGSKGMYIHSFINASLIKNPSKIIISAQKYQSHLVSTFFDHIDFSNKKLINSSFLTDKIMEYIFSMNYSEDQKKQNSLFKKSITLVLSKIIDNLYKKEVIVLLISKFETINPEVLNYLLEEQYKKLPITLQEEEFIIEKKNLLATQIGRIAPDFSWKKNGKTLELSTLNDGQYYLLIFWSTGCSHCLREIPQLHQFLKMNKKISVIAFCLEKNDFEWKKYKKKLPNWHHIFGEGYWENKILKTYNINATPSYLILDATKKIIAKPAELKEVKAFIEML